ncbi:Rv3235 family protein, partial [Micromonospora echinofusca]
AAASAQATAAARRFAATLLEFLNGYRPVGQLRSLASPAQAGSLVEQLSRTMTRLGPPVRSDARPRIRLRALRACEPRPGVVEAAAVLDGPEKRVWAIAFRLEQQPGRWVTTVLQAI